MATYDDPKADAAEAADALRGLAHASRSFEQPGDLYPVLGDVLNGVRSLRQVLDQLATGHLRERALAHDDTGAHGPGAREALRAADELHRASRLIDQAEDRIDAAMNSSSSIAWQPETQTVPQEPARRWVNVVFLQGEEADQVLEQIEHDGPDAAIDHLAHWDYGDETTDAAMVNGAVYDEDKLPVGPLDRTVSSGEYTMTYSSAMGHVGLYRTHSVDPADQLPDTPERSAASRPHASMGQPAGRIGTGSAGSPFAHPAVAAIRRERGLGL